MKANGSVVVQRPELSEGQHGVPGFLGVVKANSLDTAVRERASFQNNTYQHENASVPQVPQAPHQTQAFRRWDLNATPLGKPHSGSENRATRLGATINPPVNLSTALTNTNTISEAFAAAAAAEAAASAAITAAAAATKAAAAVSRRNAEPGCSQASCSFLSSLPQPTPQFTVSSDTNRVEYAPIPSPFNNHPAFTHSPHYAPVTGPSGAQPKPIPQPPHNPMSMYPFQSHFSSPLSYQSANHRAVEQIAFHSNFPDPRLNPYSAPDPISEFAQKLVPCEFSPIPPHMSPPDPETPAAYRAVTSLPGVAPPTSERRLSSMRLASKSLPLPSPSDSPHPSSPTSPSGSFFSCNTESTITVDQPPAYPKQPNERAEPIPADSSASRQVQGQHHFKPSTPGQKPFRNMLVSPDIEIICIMEPQPDSAPTCSSCEQKTEFSSARSTSLRPDSSSNAPSWMSAQPAIRKQNSRPEVPTSAATWRSASSTGPLQNHRSMVFQSATSSDVGDLVDVSLLDSAPHKSIQTRDGVVSSHGSSTQSCRIDTTNASGKTNQKSLANSKNTATNRRKVAAVNGGANSETPGFPPNGTSSAPSKASTVPGRKLNRLQRLLLLMRLHPLLAFWCILFVVATMAGGGVFNDSIYGIGTRFRCFGYLYTAAKTGGGMLLFTWPLVLLTMCRTILTAGSTTFLNRVFPFVHHLLFHKLLVGVGCAAVALHVGCHLARAITQIRIPVPDGCERAETLTMVMVTQKQLWTSEVVITGILLLLVMIIITTVAFLHSHRQANAVSRKATNYTIFVWTHLLQYPFWVLFWLHPLRTMFHNHNKHNHGSFATAWWFLMLPCAALAYQKLKRTWCEAFLRPHVKSVRVLKGNVMELKLSKPSGWHHKPGMFARLKIPAISHTEWHPFTITSAPEDPFISFLIRVNGDWTGKLFAIMEQAEQLNTSVKFKSFQPSSTQPSFLTRSFLIPLASLLWSRKQHSSIKHHPGFAPGSDSLLPVFDQGKQSGTSAGTTRYCYESSSAPTAASRHWPSVHLEGPFLAPSQEQDRYSNVLLVGGGIGVTPMLAIVRDACYRLAMTATMDWLTRSESESCTTPNTALASISPHTAAQPLLHHIPVNGGITVTQQERRWQRWVEKSAATASRKIHCHWVIPSASCISWITDTLQLIDQVKGWGMISVTIHATRAESPDEVVQALPLSARKKVEVKVGRPNWDQEMGTLEGLYPEGDVGVVFCGPPALGQSVWGSCLEHSTGSTKFRCYCEKF